MEINKLRLDSILREGDMITQRVFELRKRYGMSAGVQVTLAAKDDKNKKAIVVVSNGRTSDIRDKCAASFGNAMVDALKDGWSLEIQVSEQVPEPGSVSVTQVSPKKSASKKAATPKRKTSPRKKKSS